MSDGDGADRGAAAIRRTLAKRGPGLEARLREADGWSRVGRRWRAKSSYTGGDVGRLLGLGPGGARVVMGARLFPVAKDRHREGHRVAHADLVAWLETAPAYAHALARVREAERRERGRGLFLPTGTDPKSEATMTTGNDGETYEMGPTLTDHLAECLRRAGRPMRAGDLADAALAAGYRTRGPYTFGNTVRAALARDPRRFVLVGRGLWALNNRAGDQAEQGP